MINSKRLGDLITSRRKTLKISQRELGRRAGLSGAYISRLESGEEIDISKSTFFSIFDALGIGKTNILPIYAGSIKDFEVLADGSIKEKGGRVRNPDGSITLTSAQLFQIRRKINDSETLDEIVYCRNEETHFVLQPPQGYAEMPTDLIQHNWLCHPANPVKRTWIDATGAIQQLNIKGDLPDGTLLLKNGKLVFPGEQREEILSTSERELLELWRQIPGDKVAAMRFLEKFYDVCTEKKPT